MNDNGSLIIIYPKTLQLPKHQFQTLAVSDSPNLKHIFGHTSGPAYRQPYIGLYHPHTSSIAIHSSLSATCLVANTHATEMLHVLNASRNNDRLMLWIGNMSASMKRMSHFARATRSLLCSPVQPLGSCLTVFESHWVRRITM